MELLRLPKSMFNDGVVLLQMYSEDTTKLEKSLKRLFDANFSIKHLRDDLYILKLKDAVKNVTIFRASFPAIINEEVGLKKALLIPCENQILYTFINKVEDGHYYEFFRLARENPAIYDETMYLILGVKKSLLYTLKVYIENNCSSRNSQIDLFLHYNTVDYRIKRCAEVLGMNFDLFPTRAYLYEMLDKIDFDENDKD